jgi:hypothetical protein
MLAFRRNAKKKPLAAGRKISLTLPLRAGLKKKLSDFSEL